MFASVVLLVVAVLLLVLLGHNRRSKNFPPGPQTIPFFGNLLELNLEDPLTDLERLTKRYGNVYSFFIGPRPAIVINGLQALKEAFVNKAAAFAGRPQDQFFNRIVQMKELQMYVLQRGKELRKQAGRESEISIVTTHAPGMILSDYTSGWKEHRRFGLMTLKNFGLGKYPMEQRILTELQYLIRTLEQSNGKPVNPHLLFHKATSNIMCQVLLSKRFDYEDESINLFINFFHETSTAINGRWGLIYDAFAVVKYLPLPFQRCSKLFESAHKRHLEEYLENKKTRVPGKPRNFIDCYLDELDKRGQDGSSFSEEQLRASALDLHFAGTDTTASTMQFGFFYLTAYPEIQERCQEEIDKVLDGKDQASFEDRDQMPYVQAVVHEIHRVGNIAPLSLFHMVTEDTELMGYSIPRGTTVIPNLSSALNEEGEWKYPHEFNPENFLNDKGEFVKPEAFLPFSIGHRTCIGENLARMEVFLTVVTLLRRFKFIWPEDAGEPDFTHLFGSIQTPKPYRMKVILRERSYE